MDKGKKWYRSKTFWAGVVVLVATLVDGLFITGWGRENVVGGVMAALMVFLRTLTTTGILFPVLLVAVLTTSGCPSWTRSDTAATGMIASEAACMAAALACQQWGGDTCTGLVGLGCTFGKAKLGDVLNRWAAQDKPVPAVQIQAQVKHAFKTVPVLMAYEDKVIRAAGVRAIGFTRPASTTGAAPGCAVDKPPLEIK